MYVRCRTIRAPRLRHDVASPINMDLFEAEVRVRCKLEAGGTLLPFWETASDLKGGWLHFNGQCLIWHRLRASCWARTGLADRLASSPPAASPPVGASNRELGCWPETAISQASSWPWSSVVPSQPCGLVHTKAMKSDSTPLLCAIKLFVWARSRKFD